MNISTHTKGLLITFAAVLILSPDALLVRLVRCDVWTLLFWRCLLTGCMQSVFLAITYRRQFLQTFHNVGRTGILSACIVAAGSLMFVNSLKQTTAANTLIILAASPLISSLLSRIFLREKIARRTWVAIVICFAGILMIFSGSLTSGLLLGGEIVAGHFIDGVAGLQFASHETIRRLRDGLDEGRVWWLNAVDPASPCSLGFDLDDSVYIPAARGLELFDREGLHEIDILYAENAPVDEVVAGVTRVLTARHGSEDFTVVTQQQMLDVLGSIVDYPDLAPGSALELISYSNQCGCHPGNGGSVSPSISTWPESG